MNDSKHLSYVRGLHAESRAANFLKEKGYDIIGKRIKTPHGEIDLLATHATTLIAVEVKYRQTLQQAHYSILPAQQKRIENSLSWLTAQIKGGIIPKGLLNMIDLQIIPFQRLDVVLVCPGQQIIHYQNAWLAHT